MASKKNLQKNKAREIKYAAYTMELMLSAGIPKRTIADILATATLFVAGNGKNTMKIMTLGKKLQKIPTKLMKSFVKLLPSRKSFIAQL